MQSDACGQATRPELEVVIRNCTLWDHGGRLRSWHKTGEEEKGLMREADRRPCELGPRINRHHSMAPKYGA